MLEEMSHQKRETTMNSSVLNVLGLSQYAAEHLNGGASAKSVKMATGPL
jgi:hypothetical protein